MPERPIEKQGENLSQLANMIETLYEMNREFNTDVGYSSATMTAFQALIKELGSWYWSVRCRPPYSLDDEIPF